MSSAMPIDYRLSANLSSAALFGCSSSQRKINHRKLSLILAAIAFILRRNYLVNVITANFVINLQIYADKNGLRKSYDILHA